MGKEWDEMVKSGYTESHKVCVLCCYLRKLVLGFAGREVKDVLKEMILVS